MLIVGDAIVSENILEKHFACRLSKCKGACCVKGDAGAPLERNEIELIQNDLPEILPFVAQKGSESIGAKGFYEHDATGELVTACLPEGDCVFVAWESDVAVCGIEKAHLAGKTSFRKPLSCHLYPVRAKKIGDYTALNYHQWDICAPACAAGEEAKIPVFRFVKDALVRKMGQEWYDELELLAEDWLKNSDKNNR